MVSGGITKDGLSICNVHPCCICDMWIRPNLVLCVKGGMRIHSRCAGVKIVTLRVVTEVKGLWC